MKTPQLNIDLIVRYLTNEEDNKSKEMIDKIIHDDENSRREFDEYVNVWEKSADVGDFEKIDPEKDWLKVRSRFHLKGTRKKIPIRSYFLRIAAIFILALGLAYLLVEVMKTTTQTDSNYYEIASVNEIKEINLPDGSMVYMNKHSKIIRNSDFGENNRDIILEGEAFFDVASNKELPFKVHSQNSTIEVVGTRFNVHTDSVQVTVSVISGKVAFYASNNTSKRIELEKENSGIFDVHDELFTPKNTIDYNQLAWHTGEFDFQEIPLNRVCNVLANYYGLEFIHGENILFVDSINGDFSTHSLYDILKDINSALTEDIVIIATDTKLIVSKQ